MPSKSAVEWSRLSTLCALDGGVILIDFLDGFSGVDRPENLFEFLDHVDSNESVQFIKRRMTEICSVGEGQKVLDVGCGLGHEVVRLAEFVGTTGSAVGVDIAEAFVAEAKRRAAPRGRNIEFQIGSAVDLPFSDGVFDMCRAERVLVLLDDPFTALQEMARVVRPGGQVVVFDFDLSRCRRVLDFSALKVGPKQYTLPNAMQADSR